MADTSISTLVAALPTQTARTPPAISTRATRSFPGLEMPVSARVSLPYRSCCALLTPLLDPPPPSYPRFRPKGILDSAFQRIRILKLQQTFYR